MIEPSYLSAGAALVVVGFTLYDRLTGGARKAASAAADALAKAGEALHRLGTHEQVCSMRQEEIKRDLSDIKSTAEADRDESREFRDALAKKLTGIEIDAKVAAAMAKQRIRRR